MFKPYQQSQAQLLPPCLDEAIAKDHVARLINHVVDTMDLSFLERQYSSQGQHAYPPSMLLKILVYGYSIGVRSSRKLADKLSEDIVFMWLSGRLTPDFRTIADFRKDKLSDFKKVFEHVLGTCFDLDMAHVGKVTIDGTSIRASAGKNRVVYRKNLEKQKMAISEKVDEIIKEAEDLDHEEERLYGNSSEHRTGRDFTKAGLERALKKIGVKKERLARRESILKVKKTVIETKERKMRKDRNSFASADKDATLMMMKEGYLAPGYNTQLATEHQVILSYGVFPNRNDSKLMKPMIMELQKRTKKTPDIVIADAGYGNKKTYRFLKKEKIAAFIPYGSYERDRTLRNHGINPLPQDPVTELERYKATVRLRLESDLGKALSKRRREDVEPTIGNLKRNLQFRRFILRGIKKCELELGLVSLAHNLKKIKRRVAHLVRWNDGRRQTIELGGVLGYVLS